MKPYSMDLRRKVLSAFDRGESAAAVARRFDIHERTVRDFVRRREAGRAATPAGPPVGAAPL